MEPLLRWEGATAAELASRWGLPAVQLFRTVGSTNDVARELAEMGAPHGTVVLAEEQLSGRGRSGRGWASPPGLGIWLSLVVRRFERGDPGLLPLIVGLATAQALDPFTRPATPQLKWPNDLLLGGRKLGGILCEGVWVSARPAFVVVGVGLNVLHSPGDFPEELRPLATSVRIGAGWMPDRVAVAGAVIRGVQEITAAPLTLEGPRAAEMEARDALRGRRVAVMEPATGELRCMGTALGIAPDGALLLRVPEGVIRPIHSGTVRLAS